jgi:hypothetical protein
LRGRRCGEATIETRNFHLGSCDLTSPNALSAEHACRGSDPCYSPPQADTVTCLALPLLCAPRQAHRKLKLIRRRRVDAAATQHHRLEVGHTSRIFSTAGSGAKKTRGLTLWLRVLYDQNLWPGALELLLSASRSSARLASCADRGGHRRRARQMRASR